MQDNRVRMVAAAALLSLTTGVTPALAQEGNVMMPPTELAALAQAAEDNLVDLQQVEEDAELAQQQSADARRLRDQAQEELAAARGELRRLRDLRAAAEPDQEQDPHLAGRITAQENIVAELEEIRADRATAETRARQSSREAQGRKADALAMEEEVHASLAASGQPSPDTLPTPGPTADAGTREQVDTVLARALSQVGVPYAWGGGNAFGPTAGLSDGASADTHGDFRKIGFDCAGLVQYAFAGIGVDLPGYTGQQYRYGTKIDPQHLQPGDLIFYGPRGGDHVAIYLGEGMMVEAPASGGTVRQTPLRTEGMAEHAVRLIP